MPAVSASVLSVGSVVKGLTWGKIAPGELGQVR
jgi:hypothetical protein